MPVGVPVKTPKSKQEWENQKDHILDLFITQGLPMPIVLEVLREEGFDVTEAAVDYRLERWGHRRSKYVKKHHKAQFCRILERRLAEGETFDETTYFYYKTREIRYDDVLRWYKDRRIRKVIENESSTTTSAVQYQSKSGGSVHGEAQGCDTNDVHGDGLEKSTNNSNASNESSISDSEHAMEQTPDSPALITYDHLIRKAPPSVPDVLEDHELGLLGISAGADLDEFTNPPNPDLASGTLDTPCEFGQQCPICKIPPTDDEAWLDLMIQPVDLDLPFHGAPMLPYPWRDDDSFYWLDSQQKSWP